MLPKKVYMVGIGGIGMSALAQFFKAQGIDVSGSDRSASLVTELLESKGISVAIGGGKVPDDTALLVYSDAVLADHPERIFARTRNIPESSYFTFLGEVSKGMHTIAVTGTHGKTTTTAMVAKILYEAKKEPTAIIGSLVADFGSNFLLGNNELLVVEACEYRNHVLELNYSILVMTNVEWDHTDFFLNLEELKNMFRNAIEKLPLHGVLVTNPNDPVIESVLLGRRLDIKVVDYTKEHVPELTLIGEFNKANARAAKAAVRAFAPDISESAIDHSLETFRGTWRRFEYKGKTKNGADVYDDYAHHPTAVRSTLEAVRARFPDKKRIVVFHPHLYSRTRDLMNDFAASFDDADQVIVAPIFAAREEPISGITSEALAEHIRARGKDARAFSSLDDVYTYLTTDCGLQTADVLITMGAGDVYKIAEKITQG